MRLGLKVRFLIFIILFPFFASAEVLELAPLDGYITNHNPRDKNAALYVMERCTGLFAYLAAISAEDDSEMGRKFHEDSQNAILRTALARSNYVQKNFDKSAKLMPNSDNRIADFALAYSKLSDEILANDGISKQNSLVIIDLKSCSDIFIKQSKSVK